MRIVFDSNVLISAFASEGLCAGLLARANKKEFDLFYSPSIVGEFEEALEKKIGLIPEEIREARSLLEGAAKPVDPAGKMIHISGICRDESDHAVLEAALACRAEGIVTGDQDLLELKEFRKIKILSPRDFELLFQ